MALVVLEVPHFHFAKIPGEHKRTRATAMGIPSCVFFVCEVNDECSVPSAVRGLDCLILGSWPARSIPGQLKFRFLRWRPGSAFRRGGPARPSVLWATE